METIADKLNKVLLAKEGIRTAIGAKGQEIGTEVPFEDYGLKIAGIESGTPPDDPTGSPGSKYLIAGDHTAGYFGVVLSSDMFTSTEISLLAGMDRGTLLHNDTNWFKFMLDGRIIFRSQKPNRAWTSSYKIEAFYLSALYMSQYNKTFVKNGITYKHIYLSAYDDGYLDKTLKAGIEPDVEAYEDTLNSEWNRLMLPLSYRSKNDNWEDKTHTRRDTPNWASLSDEELYVSRIAGDGNRHVTDGRAFIKKTNGLVHNFRAVKGADHRPNILRMEARDGTESYWQAYAGWFATLEVVQ